MRAFLGGFVCVFFLCDTDWDFQDIEKYWQMAMWNFVDPDRFFMRLRIVSDRGAPKQQAQA